MADETTSTAPKPASTTTSGTTATATKTAETKPAVTNSDSNTDEVTVVNDPNTVGDPVETDEDGKPENFVALPDGRAGERGIMHFEGSIEKFTKDGDRVMSSYIDFDNGERMAYKVDEERTAQAVEDSTASAKAAQERDAATAGSKS